jgi:hypothetical protein
VKFLILAAIVIIFVAYLMRGRIRSTMASLSQDQKELLRRSIDPALVARIIFHLSVGNKLAAIAELRNAQGLQQAAAEFLVEQIRKGHRPPGSTAGSPGAATAGNGTGPTVVPGEATVKNEERLG